MKKCLFLIAIFISLHSNAQQFYFPKTYYADTAAINDNISKLATVIIPLYKDPDSVNYYENLLRYQIAAKMYKESAKSLAALRNILKREDATGYRGRDFQYETYSVAKLSESKEHIRFSDAYKTVLLHLYNELPAEAQRIAATNFSPDVNVLRNNFYKLLSNQNNRDSIGLNEAGALCRSYNAYSVYSQILPLANGFFADIDHQKFITEDSVLIPMRDGVKLAAVIVRSKKSTAAGPVIIASNIYYGLYELTWAKEIAGRGYTGVILNTRGKYISEAAIEPFEHDANDGYDAIDWISKQPWCNGKIGMYGGSYLGFSQWATVKKLHPALKTIVPQVAVGAGIDYPMQTGVFTSFMLRWIHYVTNSRLSDENEFRDIKKWSSTFSNWYTSGKSYRSLDTAEGRPNTIFHRWLQHPSYDSYWQRMTPQKEEFSKINIPVLTITGYFDDDQRGAFYYYNQHLRYNKNADHYLLIGPWNHQGAQLFGYSTAGYTIDPAARISIEDIVFQWFDHVLKDSAMPAILKDKFNYEVMGTNEWKHAPSLSTVNNDTLAFYLSGDASINKYYQLQEKRPAGKSYISQAVNFKDRSDSADMNDIRNSDDYPILDSTIYRRKYLSFISKPLDKPLEIAGSFAGEIVASINKKDVDINVQLYELQPDGKYFQLSCFITRASYAKDRTKRQLLQPGKEERIPINNSFFVSKKLLKGSRIIVLLGVNKNRDWQINYGTGKDVSDETVKDAAIPLKIKWFNTSVVKIPVHS